MDLSIHISAGSSRCKMVFMPYLGFGGLGFRVLSLGVLMPYLGLGIRL